MNELWCFQHCDYFQFYQIARVTRKVNDSRLVCLICKIIIKNPHSLISNCESLIQNDLTTFN